jgi:hypothetical protein
MKPIIENIKINMDELHGELRLKSDKQKHQIIRKYCGGTCTYCGEIPSKKLKYVVADGDKLVEWYCTKCFERWAEKAHKQIFKTRT